MNETKISDSIFDSPRNRTILAACLVAATGLIYYFSNPRPAAYFDYTFRVAENFLHGKIGIEIQPLSWLSELIPFEGKYYSAFPLGSVLTMTPFAALKHFGLIKEHPGGAIAAFTAGAISLFLLLIARGYDITWRKRILLVLSVLFGTWMWTNLTMGSAWQLALGFAVLGELGAIYFSIVRRNAFLAGCFFALAFGNRTEILLVAPVFMFLLAGFHRSEEGSPESEAPFKAENLKPISRNLILFCAVPFLLGTATLVYNYLRFHSFTDFGYSRIPGVLDEPWYRYGIFSFAYIPLNFKEMLLTQWRLLAQYPYFVPGGFGSAIWLSSPFLIFLLRRRAKNKIIWCACWAAIAILTALLWTHGNPGGWQFSYRYAMILLPWIFVILLENSPRKITVPECFAYAVSFLFNAWATYLFYWTDYVKP